MSKSSSAAARALAATALVSGFLVLALVVAGSLGGGDETPSRGGSNNPGKVTKKKGPGGKREAPAAYVVQNGDTLTSIANKTGVSVSRIEALNPGVDPQILISGQKLKLR